VPLELRHYGALQMHYYNIIIIIISLNCNSRNRRTSAVDSERWFVVVAAFYTNVASH